MCGFALFVWITRIKNAAGDGAMSHTGKTIAIITSLLFVATAIALVVASLRRFPGARVGAIVFGGVSGVYWIARAIIIAARDHSAGFKAVHIVLALISVGLAAWTLRAAVVRSTSRDRARTPA